LSNPLRDPGSEPFLSWLQELTDTETIVLLEHVSADMKRRNGLLKGIPGAPSGQDVKQALDVFLYGSKEEKDH